MVARCAGRSLVAELPHVRERVGSGRLFEPAHDRIRHASLLFVWIRMRPHEPSRVPAHELGVRFPRWRRRRDPCEPQHRASSKHRPIVLVHLARRLIGEVRQARAAWCRHATQTTNDRANVVLQRKADHLDRRRHEGIARPVLDPVPRAVLIDPCVIEAVQTCPGKRVLRSERRARKEKRLHRFDAVRRARRAS